MKNFVSKNTIHGMIIIYPDYKNRITLHALNRINNSDMINYIYLALAIVAETVATTALKCPNSLLDYGLH